MHLVRKSLSCDKFVTATMGLVVPTPWPTIWVLASDYSKMHNRTTRYIRPHPASASRRSRSESRDIDVDEWGKNICKLFYSLAAFVVVPVPCYVLASRMLCKSAAVDVFLNHIEPGHQSEHILNLLCIDCRNIQLRRAASYLAHGILYIVTGSVGDLCDSFSLFWTNMNFWNRHGMHHNITYLCNPDNINYPNYRGL